jgi:hypothetical protein
LTFWITVAEPELANPSVFQVEADEHSLPEMIRKLVRSRMIVKLVKDRNNRVHMRGAEAIKKFVERPRRSDEAR